MRVAVLSDPHGNLQATSAVLGEIDRSTAEAIVCLGDLVGYGASPNEVVALLAARCATCLCGNHDLAVLGDLDYSSFRGVAKSAIEWTRSVLSDDSWGYIKGLQPTGSFEGASLFHASPRDPVNEYVSSIQVASENLSYAGSRLTFVGHTHISAAYSLVTETSGGPVGPGVISIGEGRWIINPGSVGQPRDEDPRASWLIWDTEAMDVEFFRTPYDIAGAQSSIREASLPSMLAERLAVGR